MIIDYTRHNTLLLWKELGTTHARTFTELLYYSITHELLNSSRSPCITWWFLEFVYLLLSYSWKIARKMSRRRGFSTELLLRRNQRQNVSLFSDALRGLKGRTNES